MSLSSTQPAPQTLFSSAGKGWKGLDAALVRIPRGLWLLPGRELHTLGMHFGPPVHADCSCDGKRLRRVQKPGDIGFVPAGMDSSWEDDADCQILRLSLHPSLLEQVCQGLGRDYERLDLIPQLQLRDARIEAIGWAIKADLEADTPSDALYVDHLASALAVRLIEVATGSRSLSKDASTHKMSARQLRMLTDFIESHLHEQLHLDDLARVAGVSVTRLKTLFRNSTGMPVHQYVIHRRVEYARALIATTTMPASAIALAAGFAHQSHMASTMRRILGHTPGKIARPPREMVRAPYDLARPPRDF